MPSVNDETGITNLGQVPEGMSFVAATAAVKHRRKFQIDPHRGGHRLTLCDTLRHLWRMTERDFPEPEKQDALELIAAAFDYAKRMDARIKELKRQ
jgi:hypothetical protein